MTTKERIEAIEKAGRQVIKEDKKLLRELSKH